MTSYDDEKKKPTYIKVHGKLKKLEEIHGVESPHLGSFYSGGYADVFCFKIEDSILEKALDFCQKRGLIKKQHHALDPNLLRDKLKDFDSTFRQNHLHDAIGLVEAASKLDINSLYDLFFEDAVLMIDQKTPQEIDDIFIVRYNGDDEVRRDMEFVMETAVPRWAWKEDRRTVVY
uniref:uncharacterized protein LOC122596506 n=1 Tax=Erigeron canadensis TaxID=72917 RepID=UPI001CB89ED6|nr:uncharacterized protein LOC122596506 [Erigeron canadensis]